MPSLLMHMAISKKILSGLILDKEMFNWGSLAPDVTGKECPKTVAHLHVLKNINGMQVLLPDVEQFRVANDMQEDFLKGYYCHLYSDNLWIISLTNKRITNCGNIEEHNKRKVLLYNDFKMLNGWLVKYYSLEQTLEQIMNYKCVREASEHSKVLLAKNTMIVPGNDLNELRLLNTEMIKAFIDTAARNCTAKLHSMGYN